MIDKTTQAWIQSFNLNAPQEAAWNVLQWMHDIGPESRTTGRTTVLALHALAKAAGNPGERIYIQDHYNGHTVTSKMYLRDVVNQFIRRYYDYISDPEPPVVFDICLDEHYDLYVMATLNTQTIPTI